MERQKVWESVDFRLFGKHFKRMQPQPHKQVSHMNMVHGQPPLGARRLQQAAIQDQTLGLCPYCFQVQEMSKHFFNARETLLCRRAWKP
jgi:hypothetical protein